MDLQTIIFTLRIGGWATAAAFAAYAYTKRHTAGTYSRVFQLPLLAAATLFTIQNSLLVWDTTWRNWEHGPELFTVLTLAPQAPLISVSLASSAIVIRSSGPSDQSGEE